MLSSLMPGSDVRSDEYSQSKPKVLVVDDDSSLREFLEIFLARRVTR